MSPSALSSEAELEVELRVRLNSLIEEGRAIWDRFDCEVRQRHWHPFVAADYETVMDALLALRAPGLRFLEWGSATGVITIMADLLGFEAYGIELDPALVDTARRLAEKHDSTAHFVAGSFLPAGYEWRPDSGDGRQGTIGDGASAYPVHGHTLDDFHLVYAYPWKGEEPMMRDIMEQFGRSGARLLLHTGATGVQAYLNRRQQAEESRQ